MVKLLGILDILGAIIFLSLSFEAKVPLGFLIIIAFLLCLKGAIFLFDLLSIFDLVAGGLLFLSLFLTLPQLLLLIFAIFLGAKGIFSLFSFY